MLSTHKGDIMRPYIILNDIPSNTINGLLISTLPPISKPKVRVELEEIDGRDGDISTVLGYSAYDKPFNIGLYGDYTVDDIIKYFNSHGKVIFSNEPDKYYNYAIYEQIDYEKLVNFKTATVKMHVQPFKHSAEEVEKTFKLSGTNNIINIRNNGNIYSKPKLTITGTGAVNIYIGNMQILQVNFTQAVSTIVIDTEAMNAYDTNGDYANRKVVGNYDNLRLNPALNSITIDGNATQVKLDNYSRWI